MGRQHMNNKPFKYAFLIFLLAACDYGGTTNKAVYQNTFSPWPTDMPYSDVVDSNNSFFKCTYENTYQYVLALKNNTKIVYEGTYEYKNEKFYLYSDNELVRTLYFSNYFQFKEDITYKDIDYTIVWHAHHIFD